MKKILAIMLVFVMFFSICVSSFATMNINEKLTYLLSVAKPTTTNNLFTSGSLIEQDAKEGYTHYYAGAGNLSNYWVAYAFASPSEEEYPGEEAFFTAPNGKEYYARHKHSDFYNRNLVVDRIYDGDNTYEGTFPAWYDSIMQFVMVDSVTGEKNTTYCADQKTTAEKGYYYNIENVEDAKYYTAAEAEMIRTVALNGYWGTESGLGSLEAVRALMRKSNKFTEEEIALLNDGMAMTSTQYAIWHFSNKMNDIEYLNAYYTTKNAAPNKCAGKEQADLIMKLYNYLVNLAPTKLQNTTADQIINKDNLLKDLSVAAVERIDGHKNNLDKDTTNDAYIANLSFTMQLLPDLNKDNLVATVYDADNNLLATGRIAGTLQDGEVVLKTDGKGNFTFEGLELIEGTQELQVFVEGTQNLKQGVYLYTSEVIEGQTSQTMVGIAEGSSKVDVTVEKSVNFEVDEAIKNVSFKKGQASNISFMLIDKNGNVEFVCKKDIGNETSFDIVNKEGYISAVFIKQATSGMIWTSEEVDEKVLNSIIESIIENNKSYKGHDDVTFGAGDHTLTYKNGGKKTKSVVYTFE